MNRNPTKLDLKRLEAFEKRLTGFRPYSSDFLEEALYLAFARVSAIVQRYQGDPKRMPLKMRRRAHKGYRDFWAINWVLHEREPYK